jgi:hypothetical protein
MSTQMNQTSMFKETSVESKMALRKQLYKLQHELTKRIIDLDNKIYEQARKAKKA